MKFFRTIRAVLREVFEESAYERFCAREQFVRGRESYALFLEETDRAKQQEVRCC